MLAAHAASRLSDAAFAERHQIGAHRIRYWRSKLGPGKVTKPGTRADGAKPFLPVRMVAGSAPAPEPARTDARHEPEPVVTLELRSGTRLMFIGRWDTAAIAPWLRAVEALS